MSIYAIGDTHLSFSSNKPMNVFQGWEDYVDRLERNWRALIRDDDTVVIAGDVSWALKLDEVTEDLRFLDSLPGKKLIMKGNHDFWWQTKKKLDGFIEENGFKTLSILFNNAYKADDYVICGSRGWFFDDSEGSVKKVLNREAGRLRISIESALELTDDVGKIIVFLHYPPVTLEQQCDEIMDVLKGYGIRRCFYGHLHGPSLKNAVNGVVDGIDFRLVSADFLRFCPKLVEK